LYSEYKKINQYGCFESCQFRPRSSVYAITVTTSAYHSRRL